MFLTKKPKVDAAKESEEFRLVTASLYQQNQELAAKNKTLSVLDELHAVSVLALEPKEMAGKIAWAIQKDFEFEMVAIYIHDEGQATLTELDKASSPRFAPSARSFSESDLLKEVLRNKQRSHSENLIEHQNVASAIAFPLITAGQVIGALLLLINRTYEGLVDYEKKSIESITQLVAVALDKSITYEKLRIANEGQTNLIHIINHQIKGYLSKARNIFAELQSEPSYGPVPDAAKPLIEEGLNSLTEGVGFVTDFLDASNIEKGEYIYNMDSTDMRQIVDNVSKQQKKSAEKKGLSLDVHIGEGDMVIKADKIQVAQAVRNLIDNSIHYTLHGGLTVSLEKKEKTILFSVKDTGMGISEEFKPKLFTKGGRDKDSLKININSTGFGLAFVKGVAEAHHGRVWAESEGKNKGSTFYMELPINS